MIYTCEWIKSRSQIVHLKQKSILFIIIGIPDLSIVSRIALMCHILNMWYIYLQMCMLNSMCFYNVNILGPFHIRKTIYQ